MQVLIDGLYGDGGKLLSKILRVVNAINTAPEFFVTTLIPVLAVAMGTKQTLVINASGDYTARAIFWCVLVALSGYKKTPIISVAMKLLEELEEASRKEYNHALRLYEGRIDDWQRRKGCGEDPGPKPERPVLKRYLLKDTTPEALVKLHTENPVGLLVYRDEASAFVTTRGRYKNGKGDGGELDADLEEFNGKALINDRKSSGNLFLPKSAISKVGGTQPSTLTRLMGDCTDERGQWARYLFCYADAPPSKIDLSTDVGEIGLTAYLKTLFLTLSEMPERAYVLSPDAKVAFETYQHDLIGWQMSECHPAMQSAYPKFETYFGRFILWLHLVNAALAKQAPAPSVDAKTVSLAQQWTEYFIRQLELILARNSPQQPLTGDLLRVYEFLQSRGDARTPSKISTARMFDSVYKKDKYKQSTAYLRELLEILLKHGWVTKDGDLYKAKPCQ